MDIFFSSESENIDNQEMEGLYNSVPKVYCLNSSGIKVVDVPVRPDFNSDILDHRHEVLDKIVSTCDQAVTNKLFAIVQKGLENRVERLESNQNQLVSAMNNFDTIKIVQTIQNSTSSQLNAIQNNIFNFQQDTNRQFNTVERKIDHVEHVVAKTAAVAEENAVYITTLKQDLRDQKRQINQLAHVVQESQAGNAQAVAEKIQRKAAPEIAVEIDRKKSDAKAPKKKCSFCKKLLSIKYLRHHYKICGLNPNSQRYIQEACDDKPPVLVKQ